MVELSRCQEADVPAHAASLRKPNMAEHSHPSFAAAPAPNGDPNKVHLVCRQTDFLTAEFASES